MFELSQIKLRGVKWSRSCKASDRTGLQEIYDVIWLPRIRYPGDDQQLRRPSENAAPGAPKGLVQGGDPGYFGGTGTVRVPPSISEISISSWSARREDFDCRHRVPARRRRRSAGRRPVLRPGREPRSRASSSASPVTGLTVKRTPAASGFDLTLDHHRHGASDSYPVFRLARRRGRPPLGHREVISSSRSPRPKARPGR